MYAHLYTLTWYADHHTWGVATNGTEPHPIGIVRVDEHTSSFTARTPEDEPAGTCPNLIAAADLLYQVDIAMSHQPTEDNTAFIAGVVAGADR